MNWVLFGLRADGNFGKSFEAKINPEIIPEFIRMDSSDQEDKDKT